MPKIEASSQQGQFLVDDLPYRSGNYDPHYELGDVDKFGIKRTGTPTKDMDFLVPPIPVSDWLDDSDTPFATLASLSTYLQDFFFRDSSSGGGSVKLPDLRLVLNEVFTGDGTNTSFNLTGAIDNGNFTEGAWDQSNIISSLPSHIVRNDNKKPTYDIVPNFLGNRISIVSIVGNVVTLSHAPRSGIQFDIFYWYDTQNADVIEDYSRIDFVSSMEADNNRIDAKIDQEVTDRTNADAALQSAINLKYDASNPNGYETPSELNTRDTDNRNRNNHTGTQTHDTVSDFDDGVQTNRLDEMAQPTSGLLVNNQQIKNLSDPTDPQDAVTKRYADKQYEFLTSLEVLNNSPLPGQTTEGLINNTDTFETFLSQEFIPNKSGNFLCGGDFMFSSNDAAQDVLVNLEIFQGATLIASIPEPMQLEQKDTGGAGVVLNVISGGAIVGNANCSTNQRNPKDLKFNATLVAGLTYDLVMSFSGSGNGDLTALHSGITTIEEKLIL